MRTYIETTSCNTSYIVACVKCVFVAGSYTESFPSKGSTCHSILFYSWCYTSLASLTFSKVFFKFLAVVRRPLFGLLYQQRIIDDYERGAVGEMRIVSETRITREKSTLIPLCLPQIPHDLTWPRLRATVVGSRRLTA
jgi:hypothetical protein